MTDSDWLAESFEENRPRLRAVSYRMLGSLSEADDAVQEAWLRLSRADSDRVDDLGAWLTTVVARICLNALRSRAARRAQTVAPPAPHPAPAHRLAFVLHDVFDVPFEQIATIIDRSEPAARQLASRARRRLRT